MPKQCKICREFLPQVPADSDPACDYCGWPRNNILAFVWAAREGERIDR